MPDHSPRKVASILQCFFGDDSEPDVNLSTGTRSRNIRVFMPMAVFSMCSADIERTFRECTRLIYLCVLGCYLFELQTDKIADAFGISQPDVSRNAQNAF